MLTVIAVSLHELMTFATVSLNLTAPLAVPKPVPLIVSKEPGVPDCGDGEMAGTAGATTTLGLTVAADLLDAPVA
jgi:hypothetical protein